MMRTAILLLSLGITACSSVHSESVLTSSLKVNIIDVGAGLCIAVRAPSNNMTKYLVYDIATSKCAKSIKKIVGESTIDMVVISHPDADHYRGFSKAFTPADEGGFGLTAKSLLETGIVRFNKHKNISPTYQKYTNAKQYIPTVHSLSNAETIKKFPIGKQWNLGEAVVTFIHGHGLVSGQADNIDPTSHNRNGASIVLKIEYGENSILLTGDAVGVEKNDTQGKHCIRTEKRIVDTCSAKNSVCGDMDIDVMIAPHHGSHESLCMDFIELTDPEYVIFSAGTSHDHPRQITYDRLMKYDNKIITFRTDKDEATGNPNEWSDTLGKNQSGDDNIEIIMSKNGKPIIRYTD